MAVYYTTNPIEFKLTDSVIIAEQEQPPSGNLAAGLTPVGIVGDFPWGAHDELHEFSTGRELIETLIGQYSAPEEFGGFRAIANKSFGGPLRVVRVKAADAVKATLTLSDAAGPTAAVDLTAKYFGVAGNEITVAWTNVDADTFDIQIAWGSKIETFEGVDFDADGMAFITANSTLIDAALNGAGGENPETAAAANLATGANGTLAAADYTGSDVSAKGFRILRQMEDGGVVVAAEYTHADLITELLLHGLVKRCKCLAQASTSDTHSTNITAAGGISDQRLNLFTHRVRQNVNGTVYTVDLTAFYAAIYSSISPRESVAQKRWKSFLAPIVGLPAGVELIREKWIEANDAGAIMLEKLKNGGYKFHMDITSDPTDGATSSVRRRMNDFVNEEMADVLDEYSNRPPTTENRRLALVAGNKRLTTMTKPEGNGLIEAFSFRELAKDGDSVTFETKVKLWGEMRFIINYVTVGENVTIEEVA